jgi:tetratricopeptide (TPR) repeat protein
MKNQNLPISAEEFVNRGNSFAKNGDYDSAIEDYTQIIRLDPQENYGYFLRGEAYASKGDYDSAIADYTRAISIDPNDTSSYFCRGDVYAKKEDYDSAIADLTRVISIDPTYPAVYNARGITHCNKGCYNSAIADYTQAIKIDPGFDFGHDICRGLYYNNSKIMKQTYSKLINGLAELGWTIDEISTHLVVSESFVEAILKDKV